MPMVLDRRAHYLCEPDALAHTVPGGAPWGGNATFGANVHHPFVRGQPVFDMQEPANKPGDARPRPCCPQRRWLS